MMSNNLEARGAMRLTLSSAHGCLSSPGQLRLSTREMQATLPP